MSDGEVEIKTRRNGECQIKSMLGREVSNSREAAKN
jgi:hypothetical protein